MRKRNHGVRKNDANESAEYQTPDESVRTSLSREGYTLKQVVVLSRHNIRAPLSGAGSTLDTMTPYDWFEWSSEASQLSVRGGTLEAEMGQYFRKWLEAESVCREFCGFLGYQYDPSEYLEQYDEGKEVPGKENQVFIMNALNILIGYWDKAEK